MENINLLDDRTGRENKEGREMKYRNAKAATALAVLAVLGAVVTQPVNATTVILSTNATETLGGLSFSKGDLAEYNPATDTATLFFDGTNLFSGPSGIDAAHILDNGNIILSTVIGATLGGLSGGKADLIEYNPTTNTSALFLDENLFTSIQPNIDAVYVYDSGNIILSTTGNTTLSGLSFGKNDLVEYNPTTDVATLFLDGSLFSANSDVDAVHILDNGNIILSTSGAATLGGLSFADGDLIEYNPTTDIATLYFEESLFANNANVDAVYITSAPEPATIALLGFGSLMLILPSYNKDPKSSCAVA